MKKHALPIDRLTDTYSNQLDALIDSVRVAVVIPFCDKHQYKFAGGMGTWCFYPLDSQKEHLGMHDENALPKRVLSSLSIEYPLNPGQSIGSMMRDYNPKVS